jgi:UDP-glucose:glycoprotein glucosyltransferase
MAAGVGFTLFINARWLSVLAQDILRGQYQQLSADPNSLANLDQGE